MLAINQLKSNSVQEKSFSKPNFTSNKENHSSDNSNYIRNSLMGLALLSMASCGYDDDDYDYTYETKNSQEQVIRDSINTNRSLDEYMTDLGLLKDNNKLGNVRTISFKDSNGTHHYLERKDSVNHFGEKMGVGFAGTDVDKNGNVEKYDLSFSKYHKGLIIEKKFDQDENQKDSITYRITADADNNYMIQQGLGKDLIFYVKIGDIKKANDYLLIQKYDYIDEKPTGEVYVINNIKNNEEFADEN